MIVYDHNDDDDDYVHKRSAIERKLNINHSSLEEATPSSSSSSSSLQFLNPENIQFLQSLKLKVNKKRTYHVESSEKQRQ